MWLSMPIMWFRHASHVIIHAGHATFPNASHVISSPQSLHPAICTRKAPEKLNLRDFYQIHSNSSKLSPLGELLTTNFLSTSHSHLSHVVIRSSLAPLHLTSTSVDPACPHYFYHLNK
jgi:hypothetical protein